jgi:two-component system, response regulator RegA
MIEPASRGNGQTEASVADERPTLLVVDDDESCRWAMSRAFERRGYAVREADSVPAALELLRLFSPEYAVVDLRMPGPSGLTLVHKLHESDPNTRIVMLTGFASIATAVEAIKAGANDYLIKPVDADAVEVALGAADAKALQAKRQDGPEAEQLISVDRLAWEHIQRTLAQHDGNISAAARALGMHRRTLQRKLAKRPVRR